MMASLEDASSAFASPIGPKEVAAIKPPISASAETWLFQKERFFLMLNTPLFQTASDPSDGIAFQPPLHHPMH
jgi:hypothetical protein